MRTSVYVDAESRDEDEGDTWPGSYGAVGENGSLAIVDRDTSRVVEEYADGEWYSYETVRD